MKVYKDGKIKYELNFNCRNFLIPNMEVENLKAVPIPQEESNKYFSDTEFLCMIFVYDEAGEDDTKIFIAFGGKYPNAIDLMQLSEFIKIGIIPKNLLYTEITDTEYEDMYMAALEVLLRQ